MVIHETFRIRLDSLDEGLLECQSCLKRDVGRSAEILIPDQKTTAASRQVVFEGGVGSSSLFAGYAATLTTSGALGSIRRRARLRVSRER